MIFMIFFSFSDRPYTFKHLHEFKISTFITVHDIHFPFDFGRLQKITMDLSILPNSWIPDFLTKNERVHHLSLSVKPTMISDQIIPKIKMALPNLHFFEIEFASNLKSSTIMELINDKQLKKLLFSDLNNEIYSKLKNIFNDTKILNWNAMFFPKISGVYFERLREGNFFQNSLIVRCKNYKYQLLFMDSKSMECCSIFQIQKLSIMK